MNYDDDKFRRKLCLIQMVNSEIEIQEGQSLYFRVFVNSWNSRKKKCPGEALSTFFRASRDPKGEKTGPLRPKTMPKHFLNNSKTTLKKSWKWPRTMPKHILNNSKTTLKNSAKRLFWPPKWSKMTPQNGQNEQIFDWKFQFSGSFIDLSSWKYTQK